MRPLSTTPPRGPQAVPRPVRTTVRTRASAATAKFRAWAANTVGTNFATLMIWLCTYIMVVPQGLDYAGINGIPTSSDMLSKIVWMILLFGSATLLFQQRQRLMTVIKWVNPYLLLFLALAATSYVWSIEPAITMRRAIRAATIVAVCLAFVVVGWEPRRFQKLMRTMLTTTMVLSIVFVLVDPDNAIHHSNQPELKDAWHGITIGKNLLGSQAGMCIVVWVHAWISREVRGVKCLLGILTAGLCLAMTRSAASLMSTAFAIIFMTILLRSPNTLKRAMPYLIGIFAAVVLMYALAVLDLVKGLGIILQPIALLTGKDLTFTGRTAIWDILKEQIALHPLLGGGYGAYWIGPTPTSPSFQMLIRLYFYPTEGHNGYLDVINDLGWVGGACLLGYFISYIRQSLKLMKIDRYQGALYLTLIFRGFLADMSESHWFGCFAVDFVLLTFATTNLGRHLLHNTLYKNAAGHVPSRGW
jgi:exopolysaccharide production protein ExoQ